MKTHASNVARRQAPVQRNIAASAHRNLSGIRPHVAVTSSSRAARGTSSAVSVSDTNVSTTSYVTDKVEKKPNKQMITVAVDGSENSVQGLKWLLDSFSGTGAHCRQLLDRCSRLSSLLVCVSVPLCTHRHLHMHTCCQSETFGTCLSTDPQDIDYPTVEL